MGGKYLLQYFDFDFITTDFNSFKCNFKYCCRFYRYFIQAEDQLDCNWLFMIGQEGDLSKWTEWLGTQL